MGMKTMRVIIQVLCCFLVLQLVTACQSDKGSRKANIRRGTGAGSTDESIDNSVFDKTTATGHIAGDYNGQSTNLRIFNANIKAYAEAFMVDPYGDKYPELALGTVSSNYQDITQREGTGIRFRGKMQLASGQSISLNQSYSDQALEQIENFQISIKGDRAANDRNGDYSAIDVPSSSGPGFRLIDSYIRNKSVYLKFVYEQSSAPEDFRPEVANRQTAREMMSHSITLEGSFSRNKNMFEGVAYYENFYYRKSVLGIFYIPMKDFFKISN